MDIVNSEKAEGALTPVPPSTAEVAIRTLGSDLALIGKSGGMPVAQYTRVEVRPDTSPKPGPSGVPGPEIVKKSGSALKILLWTVALLIGVGVLFAAGYFLPNLLSK